MIKIKSHTAAKIIVALTGPELSQESPKGGSLVWIKINSANKRHAIAPKYPNPQETPEIKPIWLGLAPEDKSEL